MRRGAWRTLGAAIMLWLAHLAPAAAFDCRDGPGHWRLAYPLPNTRARVAAHAPLTIVAVGSSSTEGAGASGPGATYPARLEAELRALMPDMEVRVLNRGVGGETALETLGRFRRDVYAVEPQLVIWQLGTNDLFHPHDLDTLDAIVRAGIRGLRRRGADVVLMDPQYAPKVLARPAHRVVGNLFLRVAEDEKVGVFQRFAMMHRWVEEEDGKFAKLLSPDGLHMNDASYACVARLLAREIATAIALPLATAGR